MSNQTIQRENCSGHIYFEEDIEEYLVDNLTKLQEDLEEPPGKTRQRRVDAGILDVIAQDSKGRKVVIELKLGKAKRDALGQLLSYMHDIDRKYHNDTLGVIVAEDFSKKLQKAASYCDKVRLDTYQIDIGFKRFC